MVLMINTRWCFTSSSLILFMLRERKVISVYYFIGFTVAVALCALLED